MRPFWRHLFVYGVQAVYGCAIIYPANYLMGGNGVTENLLPHVLGCLYLLLAYGLTFPRLLRWLEHDLPIFFHYATRRFLHLAWLAPLRLAAWRRFLASDDVSPGREEGRS